MAYPSGLAKVVIGGTLPHGEIWSTGFQWDLSSDPTQLSLDKLMGATKLAIDVTSPWGVGSQIPTTATINSIKGYLYIGGALAFQGQSVAFSRAGTSGGNQLPNQVALVVTLLTGLPGRAKRGRMYLPLVGSALSLGEYTSTVVDAAAGGISAMFASIKGTPGGPPGNAVVGSATTGAMTRITQTRADSRPDTQRRRNRSSTITYAKVVDVT